MTDDESSIASMMALAEKKGKELEKLERRNRRRAAKGRPPLPDEQTKADSQVLKILPKTGKMTVDGSAAIRLFEERKALMKGDVEEEDDESSSMPDALPAKPESTVVDDAQAKAEAEAAAVRRISDLKNARINHESVWEGEPGQTLEGGDETKIGNVVHEPSSDDKNSASKTNKARKAASRFLDMDYFLKFKEDLYYRLKESFAGLETTLSDLQGRVSEIVTASAGNVPPPSDDDMNPIERLASKKTNVVFDVGSGRERVSMSSEALMVFHDSPCITVVYAKNAAKITPRPGASLLLSYDMDGKRYEKDPVTFLGTRFELPDFGLSFIGFIRDEEAGRLDADAGIPEHP